MKRGSQAADQRVWKGSEWGRNPGTLISWENAKAPLSSLGSQLICSLQPHLPSSEWALRAHFVPSYVGFSASSSLLIPLSFHPG